MHFGLLSEGVHGIGLFIHNLFSAAVFARSALVLYAFFSSGICWVVDAKYIWLQTLKFCSHPHSLLLLHKVKIVMHFFSLILSKVQSYATWWMMMVILLGVEGTSSQFSFLSELFWVGSTIWLISCVIHKAWFNRYLVMFSKMWFKHILSF